KRPPSGELSKRSRLLVQHVRCWRAVDEVAAQLIPGHDLTRIEEPVASGNMDSNTADCDDAGLQPRLLRDQDCLHGAEGRRDDDGPAISPGGDVEPLETHIDAVAKT